MLDSLFNVSNSALKLNDIFSILMNSSRIFVEESVQKANICQFLNLNRIWIFLLYSN